MGSHKLHHRSKAGSRSDASGSPRTRHKHGHGGHGHGRPYTGLSSLPKLRLSSEVLIYFNAVLHLLLQNFNVYRTNFDRYNIAVLTLGVLCLARRLIIRVIYMALWPATEEGPVKSPSKSRDRPHRGSPYREKDGSKEGHHRSLLPVLLLLVVLFALVTFLVVHIAMHTAWSSFSVLLYPYAIGVLIFYGLSQRPADTDGAGTGGGGSGRGSSSSSSTTSSSQTGGSQLDNEARRWGLAFADIIHSSCESAYFAGFLPIKFIQTEYLYYNHFHSFLIAVFTATSSAALLCASLLLYHGRELFTIAYFWGHWSRADQVASGQDLHVTHKSVARGGGGTGGGGKGGHKTGKSNGNGSGNGLGTVAINSLPYWNQHALRYPAGTLVGHHGVPYVADGGNYNLGQPGMLITKLIHRLCFEPMRTHAILIGMQVTAMLIQCYIILSTPRFGVWAIILMVNTSLLLFIYYVWKSNRAEARLLEGQGGIASTSHASSGLEGTVSGNASPASSVSSRSGARSAHTPS